MSNKMIEDLAQMKKKLNEYVNKGQVVGYTEVREEPVIAVKPDVSKIKPLKKVSNYEGLFLAVDCSTRTLKRANNWGIYLMRVAYALVKGRSVNWGYDERLYTTVADRRARDLQLQDYRMELESQMALDVIQTKFQISHDVSTQTRRQLDAELPKSDVVGETRRGPSTEFAKHDVSIQTLRDYVLLDGGSYFGGERKFWVSLYDECRDRGICLLAMPKNSPILHDEKGRDFIATTGMLSPYLIWVYPSIRKSNREEHLYGDMSVVKLCQDSERVFRCDIMEYLTSHDFNELLSPLTFLSEDPRCLGYPIPLFLAHKFSIPSETMLHHYHDQIEKMLKEAGYLDMLRREELACSFPDELHGVKYAFNLEWVERV